MRPIYSQDSSLLQKRAIRMINSNQDLVDSAKPNFFKHHQILPLSSHFKYNILVFMHKVIHDACPTYIKSMFQYQHHHQSLRLIVPKANLDLFKTSLSFNGSKEWNFLPESYRNIQALSTFKIEIKRLLFDTND